VIDPPPRDGDPLVVGDDVDSVGDAVEVVERLPHAHEDDIGEPTVLLGRGPFAELVPGHLDLGDDLGRGQVAHQGLGARVAEGAVQRAAHLAGDAQGAGPTDIRNVDGLDLHARSHADQPLPGPVYRDLAFDHLGAGKVEGAGQGGPQFLGHVGHAVEVRDPVVVHPAPELCGAHPGLLGRHEAGLDQGVGQGGPGQAREVRPSHRRGFGRTGPGKVKGDGHGSLCGGRAEYRRGRGARQIRRFLTPTASARRTAGLACAANRHARQEWGRET